MSPPPTVDSYNSNSCDKQFVVAISEKQARVVALPSQNCIYRQQLTENDFIVKAEIIHLKGKSVKPTLRLRRRAKQPQKMG
jgi:hypothetical protein